MLQQKQNGEHSTNENASFKSILYRHIFFTRSNSGQKTVLTAHRFLARVSQEEAPRSVGVFCLARTKATLTEERRLLIPGYSRYRDIGAHALEVSVYLAAAFYFGKNA